MEITKVSKITLPSGIPLALWLKEQGHASSQQDLSSVCVSKYALIGILNPVDPRMEREVGSGGMLIMTSLVPRLNLEFPKLLDDVGGRAQPSVAH